MTEFDFSDAIINLQKRVDILETLVIQHLHHVGELQGHENQIERLAELRKRGPRVIKVGGTD